MKNVIDYLGVFFRVIIVVLLFFLIQLAVSFGFIFAGVDSKIYHGLLSLVTGVFTVGGFALYNFVRSYRRDKLIKFKAPMPFDSVFAVVIGFGMLGLVTLYMILAGLISEYFTPVADELTEYADRMDRYSDVEAYIIPYWDSVIELIASAFIIPLGEEMAFRGALFGEFNCKFNAIASALMSSLVFGLMHGISVQIGYAIFCGVILALVYFYTGSVWVSYITHAVFNFFGNALYTFLNCGIFGDMSAAVDRASTHAAIIEIVCIVPAAAAFILIYRKYNDNKRTMEPEPLIAEAEAGV